MLHLFSIYVLFCYFTQLLLPLNCGDHIPAYGSMQYQAKCTTKGDFGFVQDDIIGRYFFPNLLDLPLYIIALLVLVILTISVAHFIFLGTLLSIQPYGAGAYYVELVT